MEIERKFLVTTPPAGLDRYPATAIAQGYLAIEPDGTEVRLRRSGDRSFLTCKSGRGLVRSEFEVELTSAQFEALWPATAGRRLQKHRHRIDAGGGLTLELDVFEDALAGLVVAEVEFPDEAAARAFTPPSWCGADVTENDAYKNRRLAVDGRPHAD